MTFVSLSLASTFFFLSFQVWLHARFYSSLLTFCSLTSLCPHRNAGIRKAAPEGEERGGSRSKGHTNGKRRPHTNTYKHTLFFSPFSLVVVVDAVFRFSFFFCLCRFFSLTSTCTSLDACHLLDTLVHVAHSFSFLFFYLTVYPFSFFLFRCILSFDKTMWRMESTRLLTMLLLFVVGCVVFTFSVVACGVQLCNSEGFFGLIFSSSVFPFFCFLVLLS